MSRTPSLTQTPVVSAPSSIAATWTETRRGIVRNRRSVAGLPHSLFAPIHYEPGYKYPLIVWLHGANSSELELQQVMPLISTRNYVGVSPRGTCRTSNARRLFSWNQTPSSVADACEQVRACIDMAWDQFRVHPERIFVAGRDSGGTMALRVGMEHPELLAGAISFGGRVPRGGNAFRRINAARQLPLMLSVAPNEQFSNQQVMDDLRLLHSGGFSLSLRLYPQDDTLTDTMFRDLDTWLMERFCPSAITAR